MFRAVRVWVVWGFGSLGIQGLEGLGRQESLVKGLRNLGLREFEEFRAEVYADSGLRAWGSGADPNP